MEQYTPILKFAHKFTKRMVYMIGNVIYVETNDDTKMSDALNAAYMAGKEWCVTLIKSETGKIQYKFSK